ncbi:hypothetical protein PIROE2DRAFT_49683, partial [Piromyces sp. E2]
LGQYGANSEITRISFDYEREISVWMSKNRSRRNKEFNFIKRFQGFSREVKFDIFLK